MPLNITVPEKPEVTDPVELYKLEVVEKIDKWARQRRLCETVDEGLAVVGLKRDMANPTLMRVTAKMTLPIEMTLDINPQDFVGKTPDEQNKLLQSKMRKARASYQFGMDQITPGSRANLRIATTDAKVTVLDINEFTPQSAQVPGFTVPYGYFGFYSSGEGRVMHLDLATRAGTRDGLSGLCGRAHTYWSQIAYESPRSEGRVCTVCQKLVAPAAEAQPQYARRAN